MGIIRDLSVALASRRLFSNWLSAGFKYLLTRHGLGRDFVTVKCGDASYRLSPGMYSFIINAYHDGLITEFKCGGSMELLLGGIAKLVISKNGDELFIAPDGIKLRGEDSMDLTVLFETWLYEIHFLGFNLDGWLVVDIGAYIGDTPLYFAKRGAFVVAVEPVPYHFEAMLRNIELNPELKSRILPINAAIADKDGSVEIAVEGRIDGEASIFKKGKGVKVRSFTLSSLLNHVRSLGGVDINAFRVRALKMDCKGCEWDVVSNELNTLRLFDVLKIEYSGYLRNYTADELMNRVESAGFRCRRYAHNQIAVRIGLDRHGMLSCLRV